MATKKASPAQIAARKLFAERAKAGAFAGAKKRKPAVKKNPIGEVEIVSKYVTPTGADAMTIKTHDGGEKFSYIGKYGAGSGATYSHMKKIISDMLRDHPRVKLHSGENFVTLGDPIGARRKNPQTRMSNPISSITREKKRLGVPAKKTNSENAVIALHKLIKSGVEYPDAEYKISGKYGVSGATLRRMYDAHFVNTNPQTRMSNPRMRQTMAGADAGNRMMNPIKTSEKFKVEALNSKTGKWRLIASFIHLEEAKSYAHSVARCNERIAVRVVS